MTRNDIKSGFIVTVPSGTQYRVIAVNNNNYLMKLGHFSTALHVRDVIREDLSPQVGMAGFTEIHDEKGELVWSRPITMTIAQIEKALKLSPGSLRIKD